MHAQARPAQKKAVFEAIWVQHRAILIMLWRAYIHATFGRLPVTAACSLPDYVPLDYLSTQPPFHEKRSTW